MASRSKKEAWPDAFKIRLVVTIIRMVSYLHHEPSGMVRVGANAYLRIDLIVAGLLATVRVERPKAPFDSSPILEIQRVRPSIIIIGDSMAGSRIDPDYLNRLQPSETFFLLQRGGAASAVWYLYLKNYVAAAGVRPKLVVIMFRDYFFHRPTFRTDQKYKPLLESASRDTEPVLQMVLTTHRTPTERLGHITEAVYPLAGRRDLTVRSLHRICALLVSPHLDADGVLRKTDFLIANAKPRSDIQGEVATVSAEAEPRFDASPRQSFLPHMINVARAAQLNLCFYRVKRRPNDPRRITTPLLRAYLRDFETYVRAQGCYYVDETPDPNITLDMYADGDHLDPDARQRYAPIFLRHIRGLIPE